MRRWLEVSIDVPAEAADALSSWLIERGAPGVIEEEVGLGVRIRAHFLAAAERSGADRSLAEEVREFLHQADLIFPGCAAARVDTVGIAEEDWAEGWKRGFPPLEVGRRLRIRPPWTPCADSFRHESEIEPAMAFGTGHHSSTLGCLLALEDLFDREGALSPVLDVGTGSGILAIAAAKLGARRIVALDTDVVAVEAAGKNVARNGLDAVIDLREGAVDTIAGKFPLILANLYSGILRELSVTFAALATPRAWLIAGGLLDGDRSAVVASARNSGWQEEAARSIEGWTTLTLRRVSAGSSPAA
jgi:ribosomal protein L11 methyltransferase